MTSHLLAEEWQRERQLRVDGYAAALTHLNEALAAVPASDEVATRIREDIRWNVDHARGRLRAVFDEANPYVTKENS